MHPHLVGEMARLRHEDLLRDAEQVRRARAARPRPQAGAGLRRSLRAAVGNRLVDTGWRLLEAGLPHTH
jgi:hypothetical protein